MDRADFPRFPFQSFDPRMNRIQAEQRYEAATVVGPYMGLLTADRGEGEVNYYGSQIYMSDEPASVSSPSTSTAPATQKKKTYETLTREEETYLVNLWVEYYDRLESKDSRKYWGNIVRELNEKFGNNRTVDKCKRKIKYLVEKYKEKKDYNRKQSGGSLWKSPYYDELDTVLGTRDVVTFQHVAQTGSPSAESSSSPTTASNPPSSAEESPTSKERNSTPKRKDGNVAADSRKQLRRERKKRRAPAVEQQEHDAEEEQVHGKLLKSVTEQGARITGVIEKIQESQTQQMEMMTKFMGAMIDMMKNSTTGTNGN